MKKLTLPFTLFLTISLLCLFYCAYNTTEDPEIISEKTGVVYTSDTSFAANALIRFINVNDIALPDVDVHVDSAYTDSGGQYTINSLQDGDYNAFGEKDDEVYFRANIPVRNGTVNFDTLSDTLGPAGTLFGVVRHRYHADSRYIIGLIPGTDRYMESEDTTGTFHLTGFARGIYQIRFQSTIQNYVPFDTAFTIHAGSIDTLSDTIYLEYGGIPTVTGLTVSYDTSTHVVNLSWDRMPVESLSGYNIYRAETGQDLALLTQSPVIDTFYTDKDVAISKTYHYSITGYKDGENGPFSEVKTVQIVDKPARWYRGQLHCHTTNSDGDLSPDEVIQKYKAAGYDFVAVSDHNFLTETQELGDSSFLTFPNEELTFDVKHVNAINASEHFVGTLTSPYQLYDIVDAALSVGAIPHINHPHYSEHSLLDILNVPGVFLLEIINHLHADLDYNIALWDSVLSTGRTMYATGVDDAHNYDFEFNLGWVMVKASQLTNEAILLAIEAGSLYASSGPVITDIIMENRTLRVESVDGTTITFIGKNGEVLASTKSSSANFPLPAGGLYVRAEVTNVEGKVAYTQAYFP